MKQSHAPAFACGILISVLLLGNSGCRQHTPGNHTNPPSLDEPDQKLDTPVQVAVIEGLVVNQLGCHPSELEAGSAAEVIFSCIVSSESGWLPENLELWKVDERGVELHLVGKMLDDGKEPDIVAGDAVYTVTFYFVGNEGSHFYRASATRGGETTRSPIYHLPIKPSSPDPEPEVTDRIVVDSNTGTKMLANQLLLALEPETTQARQSRILQGVSAKIITNLPGGVLQLSIPGKATSTTVLQAVRILQEYPETIYAEPNFVDEVDELPGG